MERKLILGMGSRVVFFGDSITEATDGFVSIVDQLLGIQYPELDIEVVNAGVGGDKVTSLESRIDSDVLALKPDWVITKIGVNDVWHGETGVSLEEYRRRLDGLVSRMQAKGIQQILMTPTVIGEDLDNDENRKLQGYVEALTEIGRAKDLSVIPLRDYFCNAIRRGKQGKGDLLLTVDGVHPNRAGHILIAMAVLDVLGFDISMAGLL